MARSASLFILSGFLLLFSLTLATCGKDSPTEPSSSYQITITPASFRLAMVGDTIQLVVKDDSGNVVTGSGVSWRSSDTAVVTVSSGGLVTAVSVGSAQITATSAGVSASATITVDRERRVLATSTWIAKYDSDSTTTAEVSVTLIDDGSGGLSGSGEVTVVSTAGFGTVTLPMEVSMGSYSHPDITFTYFDSESLGLHTFRFDGKLTSETTITGTLSNLTVPEYEPYTNITFTRWESPVSGGN